ncbi:MAG: DUF4080 domain-containing protein [Bacillota bacterium]|nr:DUF4080 domain-containing protein [Bacillota bacterium]
MKVLLASIDSKYIHSNLAVRSLKKYAEQKLRESGAFCDGGCMRVGADEADAVCIEIAEYTINQQPQKVLADIYKRDADIIMFSCYIWNKAFMGKLLEDLATVRPEVKIWLGGPEVSFDGAKILEEFPNVRGVMMGEGEETFAQLLKAYSGDELTSDHFREIPGIICRDAAGGEIVRTPQREPLDMDQLPFVYEDLADFENRIIYYESSRGCPFRCSYCLSSVDKKLRFRSLDLVKKELKFFLDNKVQQVKFVDRTFNCDHDRTMEIWRFLRDNDNGVTNFHFEMAADILTYDEIELLGQLRPGQVQLEIGVQTTNLQTLEAICRPMDFDKLASNVETIKGTGSADSESRMTGNVHIHLDLIAGLPYEDMASFKKSFNDVFSLRPEQLQLGFLKVLKGSPMADRCEEYGLKYTAAPPYEVLETKWLSYDDLLKLKQIEEMVEVYYNTGQFTRTLELILNGFDNAFDMFRAIGSYYEARDLEMMNLSRNRRYELLLEFGQEYVDIVDLRQAMILDYYSRENVKTRPGFLGDETVSKDFAKEFYSMESREHRYLTGPKLAVCDDPRTLRKHTHIEKTSEGHLLFDYTRRDPITNNAMIIQL